MTKSRGESCDKMLGFSEKDMGTQDRGLDVGWIGYLDVLLEGFAHCFFLRYMPGSLPIGCAFS